MIFSRSGSVGMGVPVLSDLGIKEKKKDMCSVIASIRT